MIRTLLVDDSQSFRLLLRQVLSEAADFSVVGVAAGGLEAIRLAHTLKPDLVVMDFMMPGMTGLEATARLMREVPCPVVILSTLMDSQAQQIVFEALKAGAVDVLRKPHLGTPEGRAGLLDQLRAMAQIKVVRHRRSEPPPVQLGGGGHDQLVLIGASTGGPPALAELLGGLPGTFPWPLVIAQHLAVGFAEGLRQWLAGCTPMSVHLVKEPMPLLAGSVYLAADATHLLLDGTQVTCQSAKDASSAAPSVNRLFESALPIARQTVGVLLTGMGQDGAHGLKLLHDRGAYTLVQDEASSLVYGMPRVARDMGAADEEVGISKIAGKLLALATTRR